MSDQKNPTAVQIGQRIKQARKMAGMDTAEALLEKVSEWKRSRLGNYEAGISTPSPDDVRLIATATGTSPCWIAFGAGPIRASGRDLQAIRHQNLIAITEEAKSNRKLTPLLNALGVSRKKLDAHLTNPFINLPERMMRHCESYLKKQSGWMDEQHVENDPLCSSFPDDMRELMTLYSNLSEPNRKLMLRLARCIEPVS
ncbi:MAG: helix-turn-helix domain-containing protein [Candidatus Thiodiazotropha sp.]|nr:helix-turn-helix domain-containing protein [Candidatus Thiodiazotropha sp.]MCM8922253.1 helix-turn-helix domain-containing protein [Candidatus Thiodiazotropha sp.]